MSPYIHPGRMSFGGLRSNPVPAGFQPQGLIGGGIVQPALKPGALQPIQPNLAAIQGAVAAQPAGGGAAAPAAAPAGGAVMGGYRGYVYPTSMAWGVPSAQCCVDANGFVVCPGSPAHGKAAPAGHTMPLCSPGFTGGRAVAGVLVPNPSPVSVAYQQVHEPPAQITCQAGYVRCKAGDTWQCCPKKKIVRRDPRRSARYTNPSGGQISICEKIGSVWHCNTCYADGTCDYYTIPVSPDDYSRPGTRMKMRGQPRSGRDIVRRGVKVRPPGRYHRTRKLLGL